MPNIFVEALTVADGKVHDEAREIAVPPESRVVDVAVEPSQKTYKPGQKAKVKVKLTGPDGQSRFVGSTVLAVYDKAVEYISGGSNVPDIKEFFWKWKRSHQPADRVEPQPLVHQPVEAERDSHAGSGGVRQLDAALGDVRAGSSMTMMRSGYGHGPQRNDGRHVAWLLGMPAAAPMGGRWRNRRWQPLPRRRMEAERYVVSADDLDGRADSPRSSPSSAPTSPTPPSGPPPSPRRPDGTAEVEFTLPESLTTWKVKTWTMGPGTKVGQAEIGDRHDQGPARPAPGAPVLRREGRGRALGQRPQQAQDEESRPGRAGVRGQRAATAGRDRASQTVEIAAGRSIGSTGGSRSPTRDRPSSA